LTYQKQPHTQKGTEKLRNASGTGGLDAIFIMCASRNSVFYPADPLPECLEFQSRAGMKSMNAALRLCLGTARRAVPTLHLRDFGKQNSRVLANPAELLSLAFLGLRDS